MHLHSSIYLSIYLSIYQSIYLSISFSFLSLCFSASLSPLQPTKLQRTQRCHHSPHYSFLLLLLQSCRSRRPSCRFLFLLVLLLLLLLILILLLLLQGEETPRDQRCRVNTRRRGTQIVAVEEGETTRRRATTHAHPSLSLLMSRPWGGGLRPLQKKMMMKKKMMMMMMTHLHGVGEGLLPSPPQRQ